MFEENNDKNDSDEDINWGDLKTNLEFDVGSEMNQLVAKEINENASTAEMKSDKIIIDYTKPTTPISLLVESLLQQLCSVLETDSKKSSALYKMICERLYEMNLIDETYNMSEFENMRFQFQKSLLQLVTVAKGEDLPDHLDNMWPLSLQNSQKGLEFSRYYREFEEIECIASGGFGKVYKARHKLDGIEYAVKKVVIKSTSIKNVLTHLTEVKTLASLNHLNIVPYKSCWLEPLLSNYTKDDKSNGSNKVSSSSTSSNRSLISSVVDNDNDSLVLPKIKSADSSFQIDFEYSQSDIYEESEEVYDKESDTVNHVKSFKKSQQNTYSSYSSEKVVNSVDDNSVVPYVKLKWATLFIQMKLCQQTLRQWLDDRNKFTDFLDFYKNFNINSDDEKDKSHIMKININIFQQLLNGLSYIHSRNIVHHDVKPSNIFICTEVDSSITIQLGDFGLACPLQQQQSQQNHAGVGVGFGTPLYAALEQLNGVCNKKSDIYSVGVILIEILAKCVTEMERFEMIDHIRSGKVPENLDPDFCGLIKKLLTHDVQKRPDIIQLQGLLNRVCYKTNSNVELNQLKYELNEKDNEIVHLRNEYETNSQKHFEEIKLKDEELQQKDNEILELKNEILKLKKSLSLD